MGLATETAFASLTIYCLITIPLIIYSGWLLRRDWSELFLIKRRRIIVLALYVLIILWSSFMGIVAIGETLTNPLFSNNFIGAAINTLIWTFGLLLATRAWLLYFDYFHGATLAAKPWTTILAPDSVANNWFLTRRRSVGSGIYILKWIILPVILIRLLLYFTAIWILNIAVARVRGFDMYGVVALPIICTIFIGVMFSKYPKYDNVYFIRNELKILFLFTFCAQFIVISLNYAIDTMNVLSHLWRHLNMLVIQCGFLLIMIVYPQWKVKRENQSLLTRLKKQETEELIANEWRTNVQEHWRKTIRTKQGFERFASYLAQQFSLEVFPYLNVYISTLWTLYIYSNPLYAIFVVLIEPVVCHRGIFYVIRRFYIAVHSLCGAS